MPTKAGIQLYISLNMLKIQNLQEQIQESRCERGIRTTPGVNST